jgi:WD40 repeat protein
VATGSKDRTARVWDAATGRPVTPPLAHDGGVMSVAFSPDGRHLLTGSDDKLARLWDVETGRAVLPPLAHPAGGVRAAYGPDGRRAVTTCEDGTARVWDAATGRPVCPPLTHAGWVQAVAFSPDGRRVATGSKDRTARVWDAATGQPVTPPLEHDGGVFLTEFSPDGRRLRTATAGGTARVWELPADDRPADDLVALARLWAGGRIDDAGAFIPLTAEESQAAFAELRRKYPADFTTPSDGAAAWHREQAAEAEANREWFAAAFHLRVLATEFGAAGVERPERLRDAEAKRQPRETLPPPRRPHAR